MAENLIRVDGIKWQIVQLTGERIAKPICPVHDLRLQAAAVSEPNAYGEQFRVRPDDAQRLECAEGHSYRLSRTYQAEREYVINRIDAKIYKGMPVINLDDEAVPLAKEKISSKDEKHFITAQLMESKRGIQVVLYAGEKGKRGKTQIFVEPEIKRLAFDQKDLHPTDVFAKVEVTFDDGSIQSIERTKAAE